MEDEFPALRSQFPSQWFLITMGVSTILSARKIFLTAWGEEKAEIIKKTVEGKVK